MNIREQIVNIAPAWKLALWNSMMVAAAEQDNPEQLLSEDLTPGQVIAGIRVGNPFI